MRRASEARRPETQATIPYRRATSISGRRVVSGMCASSAFWTIGASTPSTSSSTAERCGSALSGASSSARDPVTSGTALVCRPMADDDALRCRVEIPKGSRNKYRWDEDLGAIRLDRFLFNATIFPADYGFIPQTLGEDGQPLNALVLVEAPTFPGCFIDVTPLG